MVGQAALAERAPRVVHDAGSRNFDSSVFSATRSPGKYTLRGDGIDDGGKPVKAWHHTVCIEAAREHGTYQIIRQDVDFNGTPKQVPLKSGTEISAASLDYSKRAR
jgi:FAD:protein FMN transferase